VGVYLDGNGSPHGYLLDRGVCTSIEVPGASGTQVNAINDRGQIVGIWEGPGAKIHGFLLENGKFTTIDAPGAAPSTATTGINDRGQIVGVRDVAPATASVRDRAMLPAQNGPYVRMTSNW
jgi:uncharacterized membrane protein